MPKANNTELLPAERSFSALACPWPAVLAGVLVGVLIGAIIGLVVAKHTLVAEASSLSYREGANWALDAVLRHEAFIQPTNFPTGTVFRNCVFVQIITPSAPLNVPDRCWLENCNFWRTQ